mmetsp:Transcript_2051/g.3853  ORF Transcript_2051/g.3853 Transcript_2051/m.3853 type:complete len:147 (-) Transcript_2051:245-685(-)
MSRLVHNVRSNDDITVRRLNMTFIHCLPIKKLYIDTRRKGRAIFKSAIVQLNVKADGVENLRKVISGNDLRCIMGGDQTDEPNPCSQLQDGFASDDVGMLDKPPAKDDASVPYLISDVYLDETHLSQSKPVWPNRQLHLLRNFTKG